MSSEKIYLPITVVDAARERIRRLFDEFEVVMVNFSGGKDSTVILNLTLEIAAEKNRLPIPVYFLDQEAEWQSVIDYIRTVMHDPGVTPYWLQVPIRLFNATSEDQPWLQCWHPGEAWIREREPDSIHENVIGTDRFHKALDAMPAHYFAGKKVAQIAGVRCQESPSRMRALTGYATYRDITWGKKHELTKGQYTFYPIYDWQTSDVWKYIHDHALPYCSLYDAMYQLGVPINKMRVSNVHHETAISSLTILQEIEPQTWNAVLDRVSGVNAVNHFEVGYRLPKALPWMFADWREYRDHLLDNLVIDPKNHAYFRDSFDRWDAIFEPCVHVDVWKMECASIMVNDVEGIKYDNFRAAYARYRVKRGVREGAPIRFAAG